MEFAEGGTLDQLLAETKNKPLSIEEIVRIFTELLQAVNVLHS